MFQRVVVNVKECMTSLNVCRKVTGSRMVQAITPSLRACGSELHPELECAFAGGPSNALDVHNPPLKPAGEEVGSGHEAHLLARVQSVLTSLQPLTPWRPRVFQCHLGGEAFMSCFRNSSLKTPDNSLERRYAGLLVWKLTK